MKWLKRLWLKLLVFVGLRERVKYYCSVEDGAHVFIYKDVERTQLVDTLLLPERPRSDEELRLSIEEALNDQERKNRLEIISHA